MAGAFVSELVDRVGSAVSNLIERVVRGTKRGHNEVDDADDTDDEAALEHRVVKKKRLTCTSDYIYKALFEDGRNSDVTLVTLCKKWHLHKVYLSQSPYFASMFSGTWKESNEEVVHIEILDDQITIDALQVVLGSLYREQLAVDLSLVVPILAAATLFQLEGLIEHCCCIMSESVSVGTVADFYEAAVRYGAVQVKAACRKWLLLNLLPEMPDHPDQLARIPPGLMAELVGEPDLVVVQTEFSLYVLVKLWIFLRERGKDKMEEEAATAEKEAAGSSTDEDGGPGGSRVSNMETPNDPGKPTPPWTGSPQEALSEAHTYFGTPAAKRTLATMSELYGPVIKKLRINHLTSHHLDLDMVKADGIIPRQVLMESVARRWGQLLKVDQGADQGPKEVDQTEFETLSLRCGRILPNNSGQQMWRWTGFSFGLDLVMIWDGWSLRLKRSHRSDHEGLVSHLPRRNVAYRATIYSRDPVTKQERFSQTSGVKKACLAKNEEVRVLKLNAPVSGPILLSVNLMIVNKAQDK